MKISALDEKGNAVDWWFLYKIPKLSEAGASGKVISATGYEYAYYDPNTAKFQMTTNLLSKDQGALDLTLDSLFKKPDATTGWVLYNDEMPADANGHDNGSLGHTKGVIAFDTSTKTALWLLHSWPKYADPGALGMPTPMYGQTFLCLTMDIATASAIAAQMAQYQQPQVYLPHLPPNLDKNDPLYILTRPLASTVPGGTNVLNGKTRKGQAFKVIAKNREWGKDFWNDLVGPTLQEDMDVETWIRGLVPPTLDSDGVHKTFDIKYVDFRPLGGNWAWPQTRDHAKWGITLKSEWVCVGDINRMVTQSKRGGGTIALKDKNLWQALKQTDLMIPPPGLSLAQAKAIIKETHTPADGSAPGKPKKGKK